MIYATKLAQVLLDAAFDTACAISGITFMRATSEEQIHDCWKIRHEIFVEKGYIQPKPNGMFSDAYDPFSINILVKKHEHPIAATRLVFDSSEGFPTEHLFNINLGTEMRKKIAEVSRLVVSKGYRGGDRLIMLGIIRSISRIAHDENVSHLMCNMPKRLKNYFKKFGIIFIELAEGEVLESHKKARELIGGYFNQQILHPYLIDVIATKRKLGIS